MKNVLFTTTALVAFAGAATAASHGGGATVEFSGELTAGYNDVIEGGLFWEADLDLSVSVDLGDSVTATLSTEIMDTDGNDEITDVDATVEIAYTGDRLSASLTFGDLGDEGASEYFYADRDGLVRDVENHDGDQDVRALIEMGSFGVALGCSDVQNGTCDDGMNVGLGATFGSIKLGVGFDEAIAGGQPRALGVSADATFGAFTVGVSYIDLGATLFVSDEIDTNDGDDTVVGGGGTVAGPIIIENAYAIELGYEISSALSASAYFAANGFAGNAYGVGVDYTAGALTISAYFDQTVDQGFQGTDGTDVDGDGTHTGYSFGIDSDQAFGLDVAYAVNDQLTANAGVKFLDETSDRAGVADTSATNFYVGIDYAVNDNISVTVSYADADEISGPEYKDGISAFITATF